MTTKWLQSAQVVFAGLTTLAMTSPADLRNKILCVTACLSLFKLVLYPCRPTCKAYAGAMLIARTLCNSSQVLVQTSKPPSLANTIPISRKKLQDEWSVAAQQQRERCGESDCKPRACKNTFYMHGANHWFTSSKHVANERKHHNMMGDH